MAEDIIPTDDEISAAEKAKKKHKAAKGTNNHSEITVDLSSWGDTMGPVMDWQDAVRASDFTKMSKTMVEVIKSWQFEGAPDKLETYRALDRENWKEAAKAVGSAVSAFFLESESDSD